MKQIIDYEKKVCGVGEEIVNVYDSRIFELLSKTLTAKTTGKVLDIGCGGGVYTNKVKGKWPNLKYYALDISQTAIKSAKSRFIGIQFQVANAEKLPYPGNLFEFVFIRQVLDHLKEPNRALKEIYRVLKPGKFAYLAVPLEKGKFMIRPPLKLTEKFQGHLHHFSKETLLEMFKKNGFTVVKYYYSGFIFDQIINFGCLNLYKILNLSREFSVEGYLNSGGKITFTKRGLLFVGKLINLVKTLEIILVPKFVPGSTIHFLVQK